MKESGSPDSVSLLFPRARSGAPGSGSAATVAESGRGRPHSTTLRVRWRAGFMRQLLECACPLALSVAASRGIGERPRPGDSGDWIVPLDDAAPDGAGQLFAAVTTEMPPLTGLWCWPMPWSGRQRQHPGRVRSFNSIYGSVQPSSIPPAPASHWEGQVPPCPQSLSSCRSAIGAAAL